MFNTETRAHPHAVEVFERNDARIAVLPREDVAEALAQTLDRIARRVARYRPLSRLAQRPQVVDSVAMIGVIVRPEHRVDPVDPGGQQLAAQVGCGVDQDPRPVVAFDDDRNAAAAIFWLCRVAQAPIVSDLGHPGRGARAQHDELHAAALPNSRKKLALVVSPNAAGSTRRKPAMKRAVSAT